jgi:hypothetical protein
MSRRPHSPARYLPIRAELRKICPGRLPVLSWRGKPGMSAVLIHPEIAQQRPPSGVLGSIRLTSLATPVPRETSTKRALAAISRGELFSGLTIGSALRDQSRSRRQLP